MTTVELAYLIALIVIIVVALLYIQKLLAQIEMLKIKLGNKKDNTQLVLAACERLAMFTERTKIENLITRFNVKDITALELHHLMVAAVKEEYEYNISQQVYIEGNLWNAIAKMKEQNIYIINQVLQTVEANNTATPYIKNLLTLVNASENATMNSMVLEALKHEAKQMI